MKRIIAIILFLLTLVGCLFACGENITPTTDKPDDVPATEEPEKVIIETKIGKKTMNLTIDDAFCEMKRPEFVSLYPTRVAEPVFRVFASKEELKSAFNPDPFLWETWPDGDNEAVFGSYNEYDEAFFETKKVVAITLITDDSIEMTIDYVYSQTNKDGMTTYCAKVIVRDVTFGAEPDMSEAPPRGTSVTFAVDKNIDITPENLTIDLVDLRK